MEFRLLGPVEVWHAGQVVAAGPRQQRHVLAILAVEAGRPIPPETLIDRIWDEAPDGARHALHTHVSRIRALLRRLSGPDTTGPLLVKRSGGYLLDVDPGHVDLHRFRRLTTDAHAAGRPARERADLLGQALDLWRGEPLANLTGQWATHARQVWQQQYLEVAMAWAHDQLTLGRPATAIDLLANIANQHPLIEPVAATLMRAFAAAGRRADALNAYTTIRRRLVEELGVDPGSELQGIHQTILRGEIAPGASSGAPLSPPTAIPSTPPEPAPPRRESTTLDGTCGLADGMPAPAQLPADVPAFTGRAEHLAALNALLTDDQPANSTAVVISAVCGTAGVGKTALTVHWAHQVRTRFPDGQLYVNLRGFDPSGQSVPTTEAVCGFLDALGVPPRRVPSTLDSQVGLYRSLTADKRILVVLDNARDADQVRPLLPATPGALAIVTSRNRLTALTAFDGAHAIPLDLLSHAEARELLARRLGAERVVAEPRATDQIITACARLPLALTIAAARAQHTGFPLAALAAELTEARSRLDALDAGDTTTEVRAVFSWSYATLTTDAARLFRLLGLHPGPDISDLAAASLAGRPLRQVRGWLTELQRISLLTEHSPGRYLFHDLLRAYAADLAADTDVESEHEAACGRVLTFYLHAATAAARHLAPEPYRTAEADDAALPALAVATREQASDWFAREQPNLVAAAGWAAAHGHTSAAVGIPAALHEQLRAHGPWSLALDVHHTALIAARHAGDQPGQARTLANLAEAQHLNNDFAAAATSAEQALDLYRRLGDPLGEARALNTLGLVRLVSGDYSAAVASLTQTLDLCRQLGDRFGEAKALDTLGRAQYITGDYQAAAHTSQQAIDLCRELGNQFSQVSALNTLGLAQLAVGAHTAAGVTTRQALEVSRRLGDQLGQLNALLTLGIVQHATGDHAAAAGTARQALAVSQQLGIRLGQANALQTLGLVQCATNDHTAAATSLGQALDLFRDVGDPDGEAETLNHLGQLLLISATPSAAHQQFIAALTIARSIGTMSHEARALEGLGECTLRTGRCDEGVAYLRQALCIYQRINSPHATRVETALNQISP